MNDFNQPISEFIEEIKEPNSETDKEEYEAESGDLEISKLVDRNELYGVKHLPWLKNEK